MKDDISNKNTIKPPAEILYQDELKKLTEEDKGAKPEGWRMSPVSVVKFLCGDEKAGIKKKYYGDKALIERAVVTLIGHQSLLLVGEPGTAKSMISELLSAAISGRSDLTIQGSAGTSEDHIKYGWNYALLLSQGPGETSLIKSPVYSAMENGCIARFEEITRCSQEIQDIMISLISDKQLHVPEMGEGFYIQAKKGFNIIATANIRDRGVYEMSSALKRRFNFETVHPIQDIDQETELVMAQLSQRLEADRIKTVIKPETIKMLVTVFQELRSGRTKEGTGMQTISSIMSTAEAVNVAYSSALDSTFFGKGELGPAELARQIQGTIIKDNYDDIKQIQHYFNTVIKERGRNQSDWKKFHQSATEIWK